MTISGSQLDRLTGDLHAAGVARVNISLAAVAQNTFTLNAAPTSGTDQTKDKCQTLTLTNTGLKDVTGGATLTKEDCWR